MSDLQTAIARLRAFRDGRDEGDQIDAESGLTAGDLDLVLMEVEGRFDPKLTAAAGTMMDEIGTRTPAGPRQTRCSPPTVSKLQPRTANPR